MFDEVAIVGVGLIGGSLAAAFRRCSLAGHIIGVSSPSTIEKGRTLGIIDKGFGYHELEQAVAKAELVVLCTPIARIIEMIPMVAGAVRPGTILTDVGSTKRVIMDTAARHVPDGICFLGGHPMAGSEKAGITATDPFLFENAIYVLTPTLDTPADKLERLSSSLSAIGAQVVVLEPSLHDAIAATVSHLPQVLAVGLVNVLGGVSQAQEFYIKLAAGGFRDMTRIASSPFSMWRDICATNPDLIREKLDEFIQTLQQLRDLVGSEQLGEHFSTASEIRNLIPRDTKGFLRPYPEVLVVTEDKPGVLARIATCLGEQDININDIEVLKVREGEGGTIRLSVKDRRTAEGAVAILRGAGFEARIRE